MARRPLYGYPQSSTERSRRFRKRKRFQELREGKPRKVKKRYLVPGFEPAFLPIGDGDWFLPVRDEDVARFAWPSEEELEELLRPVEFVLSRSGRE